MWVFHDGYDSGVAYWQNTVTGVIEWSPYFVPPVDAPAPAALIVEPTAPQWDFAPESSEYGSPMWAIDRATGRRERAYSLIGGVNSGYQAVAGLPFTVAESEVAEVERQFSGVTFNNSNDPGSATFVYSVKYEPAIYTFPRNTGWQDTVGELMPVAFLAAFGGAAVSAAGAGAGAAVESAALTVAEETAVVLTAAEESALAIGWEGAVAESAAQNVALAEAASAGAMPAAVAESAAQLSAQGLAEAAPGVFEVAEVAAPTLANAASAAASSAAVPLAQKALNELARRLLAPTPPPAPAPIAPPAGGMSWLDLALIAGAAVLLVS